MVCHGYLDVGQQSDANDPLLLPKQVSKYFDLVVIGHVHLPSVVMGISDSFRVLRGWLKFGCRAAARGAGRRQVEDRVYKFRSHTTSAFEQLQEICKMPRLEAGNIPGYKKKVMLISATPMNRMAETRIAAIDFIPRCRGRAVVGPLIIAEPIVVEKDGRCRSHSRIRAQS